MTSGPGTGVGQWQDRAAVRLMLDECETWAVVGLSGDPGRTAYSIAALLQQRGKRIVPIHPDAPLVLGEQGYAALADVPFAVDVVDVFRRSESAGPFADEAVAIGARGVWLQLGVVDAAAFDRTVNRRRADGDGHLPGHRVAPHGVRAHREPGSVLLLVGAPDQASQSRA